ncbi:MAG: aspartate kinase [Bacteroidetes bacterium]|nr:MAG: aspartate kinase [Bacteroidota bacterium]
MSSLSKVAEDIINRSPFLREALTDNLINVSALARKIKPELDRYFDKDIKEGAIIMAIKRMSPGTYHRLNIKIESIVKELGDFLIRSSLTSFTYENSPTISAKQSELIRLLDKDQQKAFYTISKGVTETSIVTNLYETSVITDLFRGERLRSMDVNLASITVQLPSLNTEVYGVYYYLLKQLAWEGLNIVDIISTANEFTVIFNQEDVDHAFHVLMQIKSDN